MIPASVVVAFFVGLLVEAAFLVWSDRRAVERERAFWVGLREQAYDGYDRVFDWAELEDPAS